MNSISTHQQSAFFTELSPEAEQSISGGGVSVGTLKKYGQYVVDQSGKIIIGATTGYQVGKQICGPVCGAIGGVIGAIGGLFS